MEISKILFTALMPSLLALISACSEEKVPANVIGYNHTDRDIGHFTAGGTGGGFLHAHHGGGKFSCCIGIPKHWNPTYAVTIGWTDDHDENYQERLIKVPNYEKSGNLDVHFLQNGDVKVFVTSLTLWHAEYPLKGPEAKLDP